MDESSTAVNAGLGMDTTAAESALRCRREQPGEVLVTWLSSFPRHRPVFEAGRSAKEELTSGIAACHLCHPAHGGCSPGLPGQQFPTGPGRPHVMLEQGSSLWKRRWWW